MQSPYPQQIENMHRTNPAMTENKQPFQVYRHEVAWVHCRPPVPDSTDTTACSTVIPWYV